MNHSWTRTSIFIAGVIWICYSWTFSNARLSADCEYVRALYLVILNREPDDSGYNSHCKELISGSLTRKQLLDVFLSSLEYKSHHRQSQR